MVRNFSRRRWRRVSPSNATSSLKPPNVGYGLTRFIGGHEIDLHLVGADELARLCHGHVPVESRALDPGASGDGGLGAVRIRDFEFGLVKLQLHGFRPADDGSTVWIIRLHPIGDSGLIAAEKC